LEQKISWCNSTTSSAAVTDSDHHLAYIYISKEQEQMHFLRVEQEQCIDSVSN